MRLLHGEQQGLGAGETATREQVHKSRTQKLLPLEEDGGGGGREGGTSTSNRTCNNIISAPPFVRSFVGN